MNDPRPEHLAWEAPGVGTKVRGRALVKLIERRLADLEGLRETIHAQNKALLDATVKVHDKHQGTAARLRAELLSGGVGEEPALEDAYGAHLMDRSRADDLMSMLAHGRRNFRSKVDPQTRPRLTVPHALAEDAGHQEMSDPMSDPMSGQMSGQEDDE